MLSRLSWRLVRAFLATRSPDGSSTVNSMLPLARARPLVRSLASRIISSAPPTLPDEDKEATIHVAGVGLGFMRADQVMKGDRIMFVPGCFHHLVLRSKPGDRWKLVGLVAMDDSVARSDCMSH